MPFIVSSNIEKVDPATRKLIRSYARRGMRDRRDRPEKYRRTVNSRTLAGSIHPERIRLEELIETYTCLVPGRVGSEFSFVELADEIELSMLLNMAKVTPAVLRVIFPLKVAMGWQADNKEWLYPMARDAVSLHITAFAMESFFDRVLRRQENSVSPSAMLHLEKGLRILSERLLGEDDETKLSDSTISVVLKLAVAAHFNVDYQAAKQHMKGLRKMVDLRGGLHAFEGTELLVEMWRCDLSITLLNDSDAVFFCHPFEPLVKYPEKLLAASDDKMCFPDNLELIELMDNDLSTAWQVMRRFCLLVNIGTQTHSLIRSQIIHETMAAVIYRLLHMDFVVGSIDETLRNGLLAFSYHIFLQWQDIKVPHSHFSNSHRNCLRGLKHVKGASNQLVIWLLMTGAISLFDISNEAWLREDLREHAERCQVRTWKEMQDILKSFMWVPLLDEQPGEQIYDLLYLSTGND
ncbi:Fc.00g081080.m01.CDS01 [Cosmosporella sp. VM-42]